MLALQILAGVFLLLSAALLFGPQLVIYGPKALPQMAQNPQVRLAGTCLATLLVCAVMAPHVGAAFVDGGETITLAAVQLATLSFSPI